MASIIQRAASKCTRAGHMSTKTCTKCHRNLALEQMRTMPQGGQNLAKVLSQALTTFGVFAQTWKTCVSVEGYV